MKYKFLLNNFRGAYPVLNKPAVEGRAELRDKILSIRHNRDVSLAPSDCDHGNYKH